MAVPSSAPYQPQIAGPSRTLWYNPSSFFIMHLFLLVIVIGLFLSLFRSTRDGLLWLLACVLLVGTFLLAFPDTQLASSIRTLFHV